MRIKVMVKILVDIAMTLALLILMSYQATGEDVHGGAGSAMFVLFLLHIVLNIGWYRALARGGWTVARVFQTIVDLASFALLSIELASGLVLSSELPLSGVMSAARSVHLTGAWWLLVVLSLHIGLHWGFIAALLKRPGSVRPRWVSASFAAAAAALAGGGAVLFWHSGALKYMTLQAQFAFFDFEKGAVVVFGENFAMMFFWAYVGAICWRLLSINPPKAAER